MAVIIAQASQDERGQYQGGQAGNQSGTEVNMRSYYSDPSNPWKCYRAIDAAVGNRIAAEAKGAVGNMNIGYDQSQRNTIRTAAQTVNYILANINQPCECDCATLAAEAAICAGVSDELLFAGGNLPWTGNAHAKFMSTGMFSFKGTVPQEELYTGDILVRDGHVVVVASGAPRNGYNAPANETRKPDAYNVDEVARAVIALRYGCGEERKRQLRALGYDPDVVQKRVNELLSGTPNAAGTSTGEPRVIAGTYRVICDELNVREAPNTSSPVVAKYNRGETIQDVKPDLSTANGYVWVSYLSWSGATRYVALGTVDGSEKYLAMV